MSKSSGTVKWFNPEKAFGFIQSQGRDIFVHKSNLMCGTINEGDEVVFNIVDGKKGDCAENVEFANVD